MTVAPAKGPRVVVCGLGPAGRELLPAEVPSIVASAAAGYLRTAEHPAADAVGGIASFDHLYEEASSFEEVYADIVEELVAAAQRAVGGYVAYLVPGSPLVAEESVARLRRDRRVSVEVRPAPSFLDLVWDRLQVDPLATGVRLVDAASLPASLAGSTGPLVVAQCWSPAVLSELKVAVEEVPADQPPVTVLHHLGLEDELMVDVAWDDLDRLEWVDHLTTVWVPRVAAPVGSSMVALDELGRTLRRDCPWDREQTHRSLRRHVVEEAYEVVEAIDGLGAAGSAPEAREADPSAVEHLREELGDLLFQVVIHSRLAAERGWFGLAEVAEGVRLKLVARHPHVFGAGRAESAGEVERSWEAIKAREKGRSSVLEGIPAGLPALVRAVELQRKGTRVGVPAEAREEIVRWVRSRPATPDPASDVAPSGEGSRPADSDNEVRPEHGADTAGPLDEEAFGSLLFELCAWALAAGIEPELALEGAARRHADAIRAAEDRQAKGLTESPADAQ